MPYQHCKCSNIHLEGMRNLSFFHLFFLIFNHINKTMKITARIISLLATAIVGLTLTSCGGGGGGGGGGGNGGGSSSSSTGNNDTNTGLAPASLATQKWRIEEKGTTNQICLEIYEFTFSSGNKVVISVGSTKWNGIGASKQYIATYSYKKTGANTATLTITGDLPDAGLMRPALNDYAWTSNIGDHVFNLNFSSKFNASATTSVPNLKNNYGFEYVEG